MQTLEKVGSLHNFQKLSHWISSIRREWGILGSIQQRYLARPGGGQKRDREFIHEVCYKNRKAPEHILTKLACVAGVQQGRGKEFGLTSAGGDKTGEERVPSLPSRTLYVFRPPEVPFLFLSQTPASQAISKLVPERNGFPASHWLVSLTSEAVVTTSGVEKARERLVLLGEVIVRKCIPVPTGTPRD